jgi:hypothetical protein
MTTVRERLHEFAEKAREHLRAADGYLAAIDDLVKEESDVLSPHMAFREAWNTATKDTPLPACLKLTPARITKVRARLAERPLHEWEAIFKRIAASGFCCGKNDHAWVATFEWIVKNADNGLKVLEGKYDNRQGQAINGRVVGHAAPTSGKYATLFSEDAAPPDGGRTMGSAPQSPGTRRRDDLRPVREG